MGVGFEFPNIATDENLWKIPANWDAVSDRTQGQQNPEIYFLYILAKSMIFLILFSAGSRAHDPQQGKWIVLLFLKIL